MKTQVDRIAGPARPARRDRKTPTGRSARGSHSPPAQDATVAHRPSSGRTANAWLVGMIRRRDPRKGEAARGAALQDAVMVNRRVYVDLDRVEELDHDWLHVVLEGPSGVVYRIQHGGHSCCQGAIEGYLVPVESLDGYAALIDLFVNRLHSAPVAMASIPEHLPALRAAVAMIRIPASSERLPPLGDDLSAIVVDETRLEEATEAHIPVTTEFGPGILVWSNSD